MSLLQKATEVRLKNMFGHKHSKYISIYLEPGDVYLFIAGNNKKECKCYNNKLKTIDHCKWKSIDRW
jgi:hypothetical protein